VAPSWWSPFVRSHITQVEVMQMDRQPNISDLVDQLDDLVPLQNASLRVERDGEGGAVYGTKHGYARLALTLIKAALKPRENAIGPATADVDLGSLLADDTDPIDFTLYVVDGLPPRTPVKLPLGGRFVGWLMFGCLAVVVALATVGFVAIVRWFW